MGGVILIVDDEPLLARNIRTFLRNGGYEAETADCIAAALDRYRELQPDIVLIDHNLPDGTGLALIGEIRAQDRWTKLVMITAHGGVDVAVAAMKAGADDYLTKPVALDEIGILIGKLLRQAKMEKSLSFLRAREQTRSGLDRIVGQSPPVLQLKQRIRFLIQAERSGDTAATQPGPPVLILGETGTGKELVARALHFDGSRATQPFIEVNCATLPEQLVESELFGHERGAFTGAGDRKIGLFQAADGGTLFLDEVGELPPSQQAKLLKALEERVIRPVGGVRDRPINVRFVAATNAALEDRVRQGEFRSDLFYRLNTITLDVPPLRTRGDDVIAIAETFMAEFGRRYGRAGLRLSDGARRALVRHAWPGNIRELRNVIEQASLMCARDQIEDADLALREPAPLIAPAGRQPGDAIGLVDAERTLIVEALRQQGGNVTLAARRLGVSRDTLRYRMDKFALRRSDFV
ncbi:sigma-54-dependent transcriptional regulator [Prosthecomicrobium hirschii]|uniref:sigma-54-dependent transcriptional regulator n=1 Tax=Prosthecodimorpha hirschii TaxID=665126 RepID=UPI002220D755|nr:sigma-54 dependent transcriptional regulator [Prosthecomicrobium hirschii]MCW1842527.1 sigma-54 dependent transcriptional regulator [Prosthecomicrobium hirschii]